MAKKLTEMEIFTSALYNALGVGHKNAQTRRELCKRLGCSDRMLRKGIEILRLDYAILSRDDGKGYYLPGSAVLRDFRRCGCDRAAECTYRSKTSGRPETPESAATVLQGRQGGRDSGGDASQEPGTLEGIHVDGELPQDLFG